LYFYITRNKREKHATHITLLGKELSHVDIGLSYFRDRESYQEILVGCLLDNPNNHPSPCHSRTILFFWRFLADHTMDEYMASVALITGSISIGQEKVTERERT
jgi:hypothetical protein